MSAFMIDKFIRTVEGSDENVAGYVADPAGFVAGWERRGAGSRVPVPDGGTLTPEEREAFVRRDYGELYRLGAHPYLLWHFTEAVWIHEVPWPELKELYRQAVIPHGVPDFTT